jgi:mRNA interferase MazF
MENIKKGDIYLVNLGEGEGSIQGKMRACIIVSNEKANTYSPVIHVVPLTSKTKRNLPTHVKIGMETGLQQESVAMAEQARLIDKSMIIKKLGQIDAITLDKVETSILIQFGLLEKINKILGFQKLQTVRC